MGLRVAPGGLRADRLGVGRAVAHRCALRLTVVGIGGRRQGNRGGSDAGNYRSWRTEHIGFTGRVTFHAKGAVTGALPVIPKPKDATWIGPWEDGRRLFDGQSWTVEHTTHNGRPSPITVAVIGKQYDDGHVQRRIAVDVPGDPITTAEARRVIEALTEAVAMSETGATDRALYEIAEAPKHFHLPQAQ